MTFTLRPYQEAGVEALRAAYRAGRRALLYQISVGGGKTFIFCFIALNAARRGKRVCILVHRQELLLQSSRSLERLGVEHGIISPGHSQTNDLVQVASVQTLVRRIEKARTQQERSRLTGFDLLVIDECHHSIAGSWKKVLGAMAQAKILGVTATPERMDGKGLGAVFDEMVQGPPIRELIDEGFLVPSVVYAPPVVADLKGVRLSGGDYQAGDLAVAMDKPTITGDAVAHYRRICPGVPAIAFCANIAHAEHVAAQFAATGIRAASIDGTMPDGQRKNLIQALGDGLIQVLTSCDIISEGTDIPIVGAAILLRPTKSLGLCIQQIGRALRPVYAPGFDLETHEGRLAAIRAGGKQHAIILDHVGNVLRHGMPDEEREWSLDTGLVKRKAARDEDEPTVRQCPSCYAAHRPASCCPVCGHIYEAKTREIDFAAGELKQVDAEAMAKRRAAKREADALAAQARKDEVRAARSREDLEKIARTRGYRSGWVDIVLDRRAQYRGGDVPA